MCSPSPLCTFSTVPSVPCQLECSVCTWGCYVCEREREREFVAAKLLGFLNINPLQLLKNVYAVYGAFSLFWLEFPRSLPPPNTPFPRLDSRRNWRVKVASMTVVKYKDFKLQVG
jgi:hypothetical protein